MTRKNRQRLNEETGHNSEWILKKKKKKGFCASPLQSLFSKPVPLGQSGHGHLLITGRALLGDFHLQISQKNSFSFLDVTFISLSFVLFFFFSLHLPICFITELQLLFIYLDMKLYNWNIGFPAATQPDLMAKNVPDHFVRKTLVKCGTIYGTFVTRIQSVRRK